jgi:two-component system, NarL family, nitrate/nitrite response regulator NarL
MTALAQLTIRVLLVDGQALVRTGLRMLLESHPQLAVVGDAASRAEALRLAQREQPDIVLLDLDLNGESGLQLLSDLRLVAPNTRVLLVTGQRDATQHQRAVQLGALGIVLKDQASDVLIKAIEKVHGGEVWLDRALMASVLTGMTHARSEQQADPEAAKIARLTARERNVVALIGQGLKNKQIASHLSISETTVRHHLTSVFAKLGVADRLELVIYAYKHGLVEAPR